MIISDSRYLSIKENSVLGRYVVHRQMDRFIKKSEANLRIKTVGKSVQGRSIETIELGTGPKKVLMWSQMHGNESTTTKAVLDLVNFLTSDDDGAKAILRTCAIKIIPMLNPDGAEAYTRANANNIDLNRDAQQMAQPESAALRNVFDAFRPHYCFNLHDQRTIYNVGQTPKPATVSFLAPAYDMERSISPSRAKSMQLIVAMNQVLQKDVSGQIGRYDDAFNANCVGDTFQMTGTPTLLFEAGHYPDDYEREHTRRYIFMALIAAMQTLGENNIDTFDSGDYFLIPENEKRFFDVVIYNAHSVDPSIDHGNAIGILYKEELLEKTIHFIPKIEKTGNLDEYFGHKSYNAAIPVDLEGLRQLPELLELFPHFK